MKTPKVVEQGADPVPKDPQIVARAPQKASKFHFGALGWQEGAPRGFRGTPPGEKTHKRLQNASISAGTVQNKCGHSPLYGKKNKVESAGSGEQTIQKTRNVPQQG